MATEQEQLTEQQEKWQEILDKAAYFNSVCVPNPSRPNTAIPMPGGGQLAGVQWHASGHRFEATVEPPTLEHGVRARNVVGQAQFGLSFRWLVIPEDFGVFPGREPPPTALDPSLTQRFGLWDVEFDFGNGERVTGIGAGRTFPLDLPGEPGKIVVVGGGAILEGSGEFANQSGTFVLSGFFTPPGQFQLNVFFRVQDPEGRLLTNDTLPSLQPAPDSTEGTTYLVVRTASWPKTTNIRFSDGQPSGLETWEEITLFKSDFADLSGGPKSSFEIGSKVGRHSVNTSFFGSAANPGTATSPIPFNDVEEFIFTNARGELVGSLTAPVMEGRSIFDAVPGIPPELGAQIFSGFAQITGGQGCFSGASGVVTNVGIGTLDPHLTSILYIVQLADPTGRFRAP